MASKAAAVAKKHSIEYLSSLQSWQLKHLCTNMGISSGPKKSATAAALVAALDVYSLQQNHSKSRPNIKSVDMGVKNLAYCLIRPRRTATSSTSQSDEAWFRIYDWQRINVLTGESTTAQVETEEETSVSEDENAGTALTNLYSPANLAPVAARLASRFASDMNPSIVLIERQRFRSMGGSSVQEWTLRVNSLEAMFWASLETMRNHAAQVDKSSLFPQTVEMNPARIAAFWNARGSDWSLEGFEVDDIVPNGSAKPKKRSVDEADIGAKRGMEKSEKISLVRHWLETGAIDVDERLQALANAFMLTGRAKKADGDLVVGKKDDLADCVVQGVTFGLWSRNRQLLFQHLDQELRIR
ncbi:ribonuclease H-like protein [Myriangium duriaei CBS 260.36]|uniref:Ribonuclease H-like protein n=1 Tax=Myriangium duriaei CBS 260.36 TaxID=1168546 RepID=A0A9P4J527_9PEZI|nr:ribonuclease H-like protein [Myriangium duriaei CBS 260.36]